jgi:hypothetical protein
MDQEELFDLAEKKLSKFVGIFEKIGSFDYNALQKFKNLVECIPTIEETQEYQLMIDEVDDIIYHGSHGGRNSSRDRTKIAAIVDLFLIIKQECLTEEEHDSDTGENIFLSICVFAFTMLMFGS